MTIEKQIQDAIMLAVGSLSHVRLWRQNTGSLPVFAPRNECPACGEFVPLPKAIRRISFGTKGAADLSGLFNTGHRLEIEIKRPGRKPETQQRRFGKMIDAYRGAYFFATSETDALEKLQAAYDNVSARGGSGTYITGKGPR